MDPSTATAAATAIAGLTAAAMTAAGIAVRRSGILDAIVKMHHERREVAIVREQRLLAAESFAMPAGSVLRHATANGCQLTVRTSAPMTDSGGTEQ